MSNLLRKLDYHPLGPITWIFDSIPSNPGSFGVQPGDFMFDGNLHISGGTSAGSAIQVSGSSSGNATYKVDANIGSDSNDGLSWQSPFLTMSKAFTTVASGDTILFAGKILEQLVTPVQVFDVRVIGIGPNNRHADATPAGGNLATSQWGPPASGAVSGKATVRVLQQGWEFSNILFTMESATAAGVELTRDEGAGDDERDASHAVIHNCKFAGAGIGVKSLTSIVNHVVVADNVFLSNTTAIGASTGGGHNWRIIGNVFITNTNDIYLPLTDSKILGNAMSIAPTVCIDISGGSANGVHGNYLSGTYADGTLYNSATSDNWNGNYASTGVTAAVPS